MLNQLKITCSNYSVKLTNSSANSCVVQMNQSPKKRLVQLESDFKKWSVGVLNQHWQIIL